MFKKNSSFLLIIVFIIIIAVFIWQINNYLHSNSDLSSQANRDIAVSMLNGLWTAFFASLFFIPTVLLQRLFKRQIQHFNSLINLETQLNEISTVIRDNNIQVNGFKKAIVTGNIFWGTLEQIEIDKSHYNNLYDIDLLNEVFSLFYKLRRMNDDMKNLQNGFSDLKNAYIPKHITVSHYISNAKLISEHLSTLQDYSSYLLDEIEQLLAKVRVQIKKDKPLPSKIIGLFIHPSSNSVTLNELNSEIKNMRQEVEESIKNSSIRLKTLRKNE